MSFSFDDDQNGDRYVGDQGGLNVNGPLGDDDESSFIRDDYGQGLRRIRNPIVCGGILDDFRRRLPHYWDDIKLGLTKKTLSSALVMFLATFCSTVALGATIARNTDNHIGLSEYLLMNGIAGMIHAVAGCQPLLILRPTGPITLMLTQLYALHKTLSVDYFTLIAWTGLGIGFWMTLVAMTEFTRHIGMLTRFAHDVFACFVSSIYVVDGITGIVAQWYDSGNSGDSAAPIFALLISAWVVICAFAFTTLRDRPILPKWLRYLLADYGLGIATFTATGISYAYGLRGAVNVERIQVSSSGEHKLWTVEPTYAGRSWATPLTGTENAGIAAAAGFGVSFFITIFFYFDQNFSSLLCQTRALGLSKGSYYHSSFQWMGIFNAIGPLFGLPFATGSLPHSPQMVKALRNDPGQRPTVLENRIAPFLVYFGILLSYLALSPIIEAIPIAASDAVLLFVGIEGIMDTHLWRRLPVLVTPAADVNQEDVKGDAFAARKFTLMQLAVLAAGWGLNETPAALAFPLVILCLVPIRAYALPALFTEEELLDLDGPGVLEEVNGQTTEEGYRPIGGFGDSKWG